MFRQQHQMKNAFDRSDMYIVCRLEPLSREINHCEEEIDRCEWMKLSTLLTSPEAGPLTKLVGRLVAHGLKNGFENVDMVQNRMRSWINPEQTVSIYHRYLPNWQHCYFYSSSVTINDVDKQLDKYNLEIISKRIKMTFGKRKDNKINVFTTCTPVLFLPVASGTWSALISILILPPVYVS